MVQAQQVGASATVTIKDNKKDVKWSGKAIKEITIASMSVSAGDPFVSGSASAAGPGKWLTIVNSEAEASFAGLLSGANKYSPSFAGDFKTTSGGGGGAKPTWSVGTKPEILVVSGHKYLKYELVNSSQGTFDIKCDDSKMKITKLNVNCPLGPVPVIQQPSGTYVGKTFKELHDSCANNFNVTPEAELSLALGNAAQSSTTCAHLGTCPNAIKIEVPLKLTVSFDYQSMILLGDWAEAQSPNVSAAATGAFTQFKTEVESHEKGHVTVTKNFVQGVDKSKYRYMLVISACTDGDAVAMQDIMNSLGDLLGLVPQLDILGPISDAHTAAQNQYEKKEQARLNLIRQTWYPILLHKTP